jgi:hypothetical protein
LWVEYLCLPELPIGLSGPQKLGFSFLSRILASGHLPTPALTAPRLDLRASLTRLEDACFAGLYVTSLIIPGSVEALGIVQRRAGFEVQNLSATHALSDVRSHPSALLRSHGVLEAAAS